MNGVIMLYADVNKFKFKSNYDGLDIHALIAVPSGKLNLNGIVHIIHDFCGYKELYLPFMEYLANEGFLTVIADTRGHGESIRTDSDLGFMYKDGDLGVYSDTVQLSQFVREAYPTPPYFMLGQGMGALGVRSFLRKHDVLLSGAILIGAPCFSCFSKFSMKLSSENSKNLSPTHRSEKIKAILDKMYNKPFKRDKIDNAWLCSDSKTVEAFNSDPKRNFTYTLGGFTAISHMLKDAYSKKEWALANPDLPIRILAGADDPFWLSEKKFNQSLAQLEKLGYESVSHRLFDGMRHDILNEPDKETVYKDIAKSFYSWIDRIELNDTILQ